MPQESNGVGQKFVHNILILSGCGNSAHASWSQSAVHAIVKLWSNTRPLNSLYLVLYLDYQEGPVISVHSSVQVVCFLFINSHMRNGRGTTPKIVEPLNFAPLRYSLNSCLHRC
jgi:hypothetical protein